MSLTCFVIRRSCSTMTMISNRSLSADSYLTACYQNSIWLSFLINVTYVLLLMVFTLNNNKNFARVICASNWIAKRSERPSHVSHICIKNTSVLLFMIEYNTQSMTQIIGRQMNWTAYTRSLTTVLPDYLDCFRSFNAQQVFLISVIHSCHFVH